MAHNLGALDWSESAPAPRWARSFEDWALDALREDPHEALARLEEAPDLDMANPTLEHIQRRAVRVERHHLRCERVQAWRAVEFRDGKFNDALRVLSEFYAVLPVTHRCLAKIKTR